MKALLISALLAAAPAALCAKDWRLGAAAVYETGKYGTDTRVDTLYIPFTLTRYYRYGEVSVTAPWLRQSASGVVSRVDGVPVRVRPRGGPAPVKRTESGPGDLLLAGSLFLRREGPDRFDLALVGRLKLPTADSGKGLGTGQMDEGVGLEFAKGLDAGWTLLLDGGYTIVGDPKNVDYNSQLSLAAGFHRRLDRATGLTALYETRSALVSGSPDARDVYLGLSRDAAGGLRYSGGLALGLSDGSPDLGLSAGVSRKF